MSRLTVVVNSWNDEEGRTVPLGRLASFEVGSNTRKALFSDPALTQPLSNPVIADGAGRLFDVFVASGGYRLEWQDADGVFLWEQDNYFATVDGTDLAALEADIDDTQSQIVESWGAYDAAGTATAYTLTIKGSRRPPTAYEDGMFMTTRVNVTSGLNPTVDIMGVTALLGTRPLLLSDGVTPVPDGFNTTTEDTTYRFDDSAAGWLFYEKGGVAVTDVVNDSININGGFDVWQAGTSFTAAGYAADQWKFELGTGGTATVTQQAFTLGQTDVSGEPEFFYQHDRTVAASDASNVAETLLEDVRTGAAQTITVTFDAKADAAKTLSVDMLQSFGTSGSPSVDVVTSPQTLDLTTSFQTFSFQFTPASITGKTLGTDNNDFLSLRIREIASFTTFTADIANVKIELGSISTGFEKQLLADIMDRAQRFYQKSYNLDVDPGTVTAVGTMTTKKRQNSTDLSEFMFTFANRMRATPTVTWYSPATGTINTIRDVDDTTDRTVATTPDAGQMGTGYVTVTSSISNDNRVQGQYTADARL